MVDISKKPQIYREATAKGFIRLKPETVKVIVEGKAKKGNPLEIAKIAGIMAAKNTSNLIPLCHPIPITHIKIDTKIVSDDMIEVTANVKTEAKTGVEMEALTAATIAILTIFDIVKQYEKDEKGEYPFMEISSIKVLFKVKG
ncbi:MAG: cyclic pyranopterin monophosphate synthase MoaC [Candidatus Bathyarchaeota archaeon]|nr:cyclic pyranopterin monophosphate synthase MoaC [Candidatus Bathyarchaeota archaeon]